jgi:general stress protein YciG
MSIDEKQPDENVSADKPTESPETTETAQPVQPAQPDPNGQNAQATTSNAEAPRPRRRGFAAMDRDRVKQIASKGGRAAHAAGTAHQFSSDEARVAGKKGGMAPHVRRGGVRRRPSTESANNPPASQNHGQGDGR